MEKLTAQADEWEARHQRTWLGRQGWLGTGISVQADLMNPMSPYEFIRNPTQLNAVKAMYNPAIAFGGTRLAAWYAGESISVLHRALHSADMTVKTARAVASTWGGHFARYGPAALAASAAAAVGYFGSMLYGDLSGTAGIGDMRIRYR